MRLSSLLLTFLIMGAPTASAQDTVADLGWLSGCWTSAGAEEGSGEQWTAPAGGTMFGINRTVRSGKTVAYEFMHIRETETGTIEFVALPSGQEGATFEMAQLSETEVVFENPEHDFPQRVIYRIDTEGNLVGRIEGELNGQSRSVDFPMDKAQCPQQ